MKYECLACNTNQAVGSVALKDDGLARYPGYIQIGTYHELCEHKYCIIIIID